MSGLLGSLHATLLVEGRYVNYRIPPGAEVGVLWHLAPVFQPAANDSKHDQCEGNDQ